MGHNEGKVIKGGSKPGWGEAEQRQRVPDRRSEPTQAGTAGLTRGDNKMQEKSLC